MKRQHWRWEKLEEDEKQTLFIIVMWILMVVVALWVLLVEYGGG